jgi:2-dehydro-3-deoxyphosphogluconate aldolase / (4S)-4-hydroxy-2-oxoglutarate aldolase
MHSIDKVSQHILSSKLIPLFYESDVQVVIDVVKALYAGGIRTIEFTNRGPQALDNFKALVALKNEMPDLYLGIGTIKTEEDAKKYIDAGADFLISPVFDASVADIAYLHKVLWIPGCMTPTEIHNAQVAGCNIVKLFPGNVLGPGFIEAIKPLFSDIHFLVTGGVDATEQSIMSWLKAGAAGVGLGSKLITKTVLANKEYDVLTATSKQLLSIEGLK